MTPREFRNNEAAHRANTTLDDIMLIEGSEAELGDFVAAYQRLIDSGLVWKLQGFYGRMARDLINQGHCVDTHGVLNVRGD